MLFSDFIATKTRTRDDIDDRVASVRKNRNSDRDESGYTKLVFDDEGVRNDNYYAAKQFIHQINRSKSDADIDLQRIVGKLIDMNPMMAGLLATMSIVRDSNVKKTKIENKRFYFNPNFFEKLTLKKRVDLFLDELMDYYTNSGNFSSGIIDINL